MSVVRIGDRQVDTDIEIPEEVCGLCDGAGEECESRGVPQKCGACKGSGVLNSGDSQIPHDGGCSVKGHEDPDDTGQCIHCGVILDLP